MCAALPSCEALQMNTLATERRQPNACAGAPGLRTQILRDKHGPSLGWQLGKCTAPLRLLSFLGLLVLRKRPFHAKWLL